MLPTPRQLTQLPYDFWYPNQEKGVTEIIQWLHSRPEKFFCAAMPTGSGKSLVGAVSHLMSNRRTVFLTATKGLQEQMVQDFGEPPASIYDIRGQNSYMCRHSQESNPNPRDWVSVDNGPCQVGLKCQYRQGGCIYYDRVAEARDHQDFVVTNYAFLLAQEEYGEGIGDIGLLIADEGHLAFRALESHIAVQIDDYEVQLIGKTLTPLDTWEEWSTWATMVNVPLTNKIDDLAERMELAQQGMAKKLSGTELRFFKSLKNLKTKIDRIITARGQWAWEERGRGFYFAPVWVAPYSGYLFGNADKVLIMSATLTEKTVDLLGIPEDDRIMYEAPSSFPPANTPIYHINTVPLTWKNEQANLPIWCRRIDQIMDKRRDRKGLIFTASYRRRDELFARSEMVDWMMSHDSSNTIDRVQDFKDANPPTVMVSPSITTGYDFPADECKYIIVGKVPYPDSRSAVMQARQASDREYAPFLAMETLVQVSGRGSRRVDDKCEVIIIDDNIRWMIKQYRHFAPRWFLERWVGSKDIVPGPIV